MAVKLTATELSFYTLGVAVPLGAITLGVNYARADYQSATGAEQGLGKIAAGVRYALSNRSYLYTAASVATGDLKDYITSKRVFQLGVRHAF